ncbi:MAG: hypothetical protein ACP5LD_05835, partial [Desulfomonilaceae bacterium]
PSYAFEIFPRPVNEYITRVGDTLAKIAGKYYGDAGLGKALGSQNPALFGPSPQAGKEIVPGAKIYLYDSKSEAVAADEQYSPPTGMPDDVRYLIRKAPLQGIPYDKHYFRYRLSSVPTQPWGYVVSGVDRNKERFLERDLLYIRFRPSKRQKILVGDRFGVYRDKGPLYHPVDFTKEIGYLTDVIGEVEIVSTGQDLITGIVLESYAEIERGDKICFYVPRSRQIVPSKTHRLFSGVILVTANKEGYSLLNSSAENDVVFVDRGQCDGVSDGTLVNIYRPAEPVLDPYFSRWTLTPDAYVGEGIVLKTFDKNATILITRCREEIVPGDIVKSVSD